MSTRWQGRAAASWERERRRSVARCPGRPRWAVREHLPDCHKGFVKRYHWPFGI